MHQAKPQPLAALSSTLPTEERPRPALEAGWSMSSQASSLKRSPLPIC